MGIRVQPKEGGGDASRATFQTEDNRQSTLPYRLVTPSSFDQ